MNIDRRIAAKKFGQKWRQLTQPDTIDGADPNRAGDHRADFAQPIFEFEKFSDDFLARGIKDLTGGSGFDTRTASFYQSAIVFFFQAADLLANCRLGNEILRIGIRKASTFDYVEEDL